MHTKISINSNFLDEFKHDVVPLEISGIVLGSTYLNDRKELFHCHENKYHFFKYGIDSIIRAHKKNTSLSLIHGGEMKRIVNASQNLTLLMIKQRYVMNKTFKNMLMLAMICFRILIIFLLKEVNKM